MEKNINPILLNSANNFLKNRASGLGQYTIPKKKEEKKEEERKVFTYKGEPIINPNFSIDEKAKPILQSISSNPIVKSVLSNVLQRTSGTGVEAMIRSSSPDITFKQAYDSIRESQSKGDDTMQEKFFTQLKDAAPQVLIGVGLAFVPVAGPAIATAYWTAIAAGSQIEEKGEVTSLTNIGIDVLGDRLLGNTLVGLFKKPANTLFRTVKQTFATEGGTEVAQDLLKYANDYNTAKTDEDRDEVLSEAKDYFTSGQILITAGVGGVVGGGIGASGYMIQQTPIIQQERIKQLQKEGLSYEEAKRKAEQGGGIRLPKKKEEPLVQEARKYKSAEEFVKAQGTQTTKDFKPTKTETQASTVNSVFIRDTQTGDVSRIDFVKNKKTGNQTVERYVIREDGTEMFSEGADFNKLKEKYNTQDPEEISRRFSLSKTEASDTSELVIKSTKTKSQLTEIWNKANKVEEVSPRMLPTVIRGDNFVLGTRDIKIPNVKKIKAQQRVEVNATEKERRLAIEAQKKAEKLKAKERKIRENAINNINRFHGDTNRIIELLKNKHLSKEDIENIVLENGIKLVDTIRVKRNKDKSLASVITKKEIGEIKKNYLGKKPTKEWISSNSISELTEGIKDIAKKYELSAVWFDRKGLGSIFDKNIDSQRAAQVQKSLFIKKFKEAGLYKRGGWFTANRFNISKSEAENVAKYYISRQGRGFTKTIDDLSAKERNIVSVFDSIMEEVEPRFFETAIKVGKTPGKVENYAPLMTRKDIKMSDENGAMDWLFRNHPAFFSLKEREQKIDSNLYELDYRKVMARWMDGVTEFVNTAETTQELKQLIESNEFKDILNAKDYKMVTKWLRDITTPKESTTVEKSSAILRKAAAIASLGLSYASVVKQALTQVVVSIIEKAPPKLKSEYAEAFNVDVSEMPSITKRSGDVAISDLQEGISRIFTGALTEFDRANAQVSLNALLDKEYSKYKNDGIEVTPEIQKIIEKKAQDILDKWYGGFFKGQKPEMFRSHLGNFFNMFIYPLTSQLNGFYQHILKANGVKQNVKNVAEVMTAATIVAYMEVAITKLSFDWDDEKDMTEDVLKSLAGNIPILSQIVYSFSTDQQLNISAGLTGINNLIGTINDYQKEEKDLKDVFFATGELMGLPKQIRRFHEGMEILEDGGITDKNGKMSAQVKEVDEIIRSFLRGKYGSIAAQDWVSNLPSKTKDKDRRWFTPEVEFLQNGDYDRKAELYIGFDREKREELRAFLSEGQAKKLDKHILSFIEREKVMKKIRQKIMERGINNERDVNEMSQKIYERMFGKEEVIEDDEE